MQRLVWSPEKVIEIAMGGITDPSTIAQLVMKEFDQRG
jgi:hypothetical protein